ncbi:hypothetical protein SDC9_74710 [bioreactor metagenome]|uniref:Uncharacterized protein n=1 Tax=bioreactor metagenome TaxID=1076179 RepID=A0A644YJX4_9ZZZZ
MPGNFGGVRLSVKPHPHFPIRCARECTFKLFRLTVNGRLCFQAESIPWNAAVLKKILFKQLCKIVSAEVIVPGDGFDLHHVLKQLQNGHIKGPAAQVKYEKPVSVPALVQAIGERRRRRLIDEPLHLESRKLRCPIGRFALRIAEIGRDADNRFVNLLSQISFGIRLQRTKHQ